MTRKTPVQSIYNKMKEFKDLFIYLFIKLTEDPQFEKIKTVKKYF